MTGTATIFLASAVPGVAAVGALYALHHLRIQPDRRRAPTLLFWRQAVRPQQTRVPWSRRFTHRRTFILLASILLLLAAALTADRWARADDQRRDVIVIDTGAATAAKLASGTTLLADRVATARADLGRMSAGAAVVSAGPAPVLLAETGTPAALAVRQLDALTPQPGASVASLALLMAGGVIGDHAGSIHWYTDQTHLPAGLPAEIAGRVVVHTAAAPYAIAIVGITFEPSASDAPGGELHVRLAGHAGRGSENNAPNITLDVTPEGGPTLTRAVAPFGDATDVVIDDFPADGRIVRLQLNNGPGAPATHAAEYRVPDRRPLAFRFDAGVPMPLKLALLSIGAEADDGAVYVGPIGTAVPQGIKAAIFWADGGEGVTAGERVKLSDAGVVRGLNLEGATAGEGPAVEASGTALLTAGGVSVAVWNPAAAVPTLTLSRAIVGPGADLPRHAAFPVLLGRLCDRLTDRGEAVTPVAASRSAEDPLWTGPADAPAVRVTAVADHPVLAAAASPPTTIDAVRRTWPWAQVLLALALVLLAVDASLRAAGKIV